MSSYTLNTDSILEAAARVGAAHNASANGEFLICANEEQLQRFARCLASLEDLPTALLNPPPVVRDELGYWTNPALPDADESVDLRLLCQAFGLDFAVEWAESQVSEDRWKAWSTGKEHLADWNPEPPAGVGWVLLSIHDTEDGPVALYVRQMPREPESVGGPQSMTAEGMRPHFEWWWTTRGSLPPIGSRECRIAWYAWVASGGYTAPEGWKVAPESQWGISGINGEPVDATPQPQAAQPVALVEMLEETRDTLAKVLIKVRRDAPDLSGKLLGHADAVIARADAILDHIDTAAPTLTEEQERDKVDAQRYRAIRGLQVACTPEQMDASVDALRSTQGGE